MDVLFLYAIKWPIGAADKHRSVAKLSLIYGKPTIPAEGSPTSDFGIQPSWWERREKKIQFSFFGLNSKSSFWWLLPWPPSLVIITGPYPS